MAKIALSCIACGRELRNVDDMVTENQPYNGTAFQSHGHYGDGHYLEINVCDSCLVLHHERVGSEFEAARQTLVAVPPEHLEAAEAFLQDRAHNGQPLAAIQAAILLCEGAGEISEEGLERVRVDERVFPHAARALDWTRKTLNSPRGTWPAGFWPRFLLGVLSGDQPSH